MSGFCSCKKHNIMKVLVLNCGSSSIKYKLFNTADHSVEAQGGIEKIGLKGSFLKITLPSGEKVILEKDIPEHTAGIDFILNTLVGKEYGCISSLDEIGAVGHRIVHGGEKFNSSVLITEEVKDKIRECFDIAVARAVASLNSLLEYLLPFVKVGGKVICYKGSNYKEELKKAQNAIKALGGRLEKEVPYDLPDGAGSRCLVVIKKISPTNAKYPRTEAKIRKTPL